CGIPGLGLDLDSNLGVLRFQAPAFKSKPFSDSGSVMGQALCPRRMSSSKKMETSGWMKWFLGVRERELLTRREAVYKEGSFVNVATGRQWPAGQFDWPSIQELRKQVEAKVVPDSDARASPVLRVVDACDVGELQAMLRTEDRAMVQIASNFNCLENPSRGCLPDYGGLVENYCVDATQGPAASFGVPAASLLRAHYAFHDPSKPPEEWGQTAKQQVELLGSVAKYFGKCVNGKVTLTGEEEALSPSQIGEVAEQIKVGIHRDAQVIFGRGSSEIYMGMLEEPYPLVDQVISASVNWRSPGARPAQEQLLSLTRAALRAAYEGAYLAAIERGRHLLLLTLIGGGAFGNPQEMILEELAAAHARFASHPASELQEVRLCLFVAGTAKPTEAKLNDLLESLGRS
ncbi:unnamed protein product, partial [Symbiodinium sp. KB8]